VRGIKVQLVRQRLRSSRLSVQVAFRQLKQSSLKTGFSVTCSFFIPPAGELTDNATFQAVCGTASGLSVIRPQPWTARNHPVFQTKMLSWSCNPSLQLYNSGKLDPKKEIPDYC
jgi:hypothetical protein